MPRKSTRNAQGAGSIRQRTDGTWEARYTLGTDPGTGKTIRKSIYGKTQKAVRQELTHILNEIDNGVYMEPNRMTVGAWLDIWMETYVQNSVKPLTVNSYDVQCRTHIKPALGAVKLTALTTPMIQNFYNELLKGNKEKAPLSPKSIKNTHGVLHKALGQAVKLGYVKFNATDACDLPRVERKEIKPLEGTEISAFLKAISGHRYETVYKVTLFTGMREGEVLGLTWDCIDFQKGNILIRRQLQKEKKRGGQYKLVPLKNDKARLIVPAPAVMKALGEQQLAQRKWNLKAGEAWSNPEGFVFTNEIGQHLANPTVYNNFKRIARIIGMPNARFHDLRHSYAVAAIQSGDDIKTVQGNLGHATASFTLDIYGHVSEQMKKASAYRMEKFIEDVSSS